MLFGAMELHFLDTLLGGGRKTNNTTPQSDNFMKANSRAEQLIRLQRITLNETEFALIMLFERFFFPTVVVV